MNSLDIYLLKFGRHEKNLEQTAFDQAIRNFGVDVVDAGGKVLRNFKNNPVTSSAVLGAGVGAAHQAATAKKERGESRVKKGLKGAVYGGLGGAATGGLFSGMARNIGRYGDDIVQHAEKVRGKSRLKNVRSGEFGELMRDTVFDRTSYMGGKSLKGVRDTFEAAQRELRETGSDAALKKYKAAKKALNKAGKGMGTRQGSGYAAGVIGTGALGGLAAKKAYDEYQQDKTSSVRLMAILEKEANFGALAAKAVGSVAQGAGKAIQMGAANPALAGAAVGATTGAITAGEGNRLKGALGGAALGAGAGAGLAKLAPQATANMQQFGKSLSTTGKLNVRAANKNLAAIKAGADPSTLKKLPGYGNMGNVNANFAKANRGQMSDIATKKVQQIGYGMSGGTAAGTALAGTAAAGIGAGAVMGGQKKPTQQQRQNQQNIRNRFSGVAANFG